MSSKKQDTTTCKKLGSYVSDTKFDQSKRYSTQQIQREKENEGNLFWQKTWSI